MDYEFKNQEEYIKEETAEEVKPVEEKPDVKVEKRCPGKEIVGLIFGIKALIMGVCAIISCYWPYFATFMGAFGIVSAVISLIMYNLTNQQATVLTGKIKAGQKLGKAGLICSIVGIVLGIIIFKDI